VKSIQEFRQIAASIREVGLVEPPVVARDPSQPGNISSSTAMSELKL
jgi:ParB-like chromosome segregation protein Spo0J